MEFHPGPGLFRTPGRILSAGVLGLALCLIAPVARADDVTDWNGKAADIIYTGKLLSGMQIRAMAVVQVSVYEAVSAIEGRYEPYRFRIAAVPGASVEAAVAAANRKTLLELVPSQQAAIDAAYQAVLSGIPEGPARISGTEVGEKAAAAVLAYCSNDGATAPNTYRPQTAPGVYVQTAMPALPQWGQRRPWILSRGDQFRPGPPPRLSSEVYAKDYNEIKALGGKTSVARTQEQTDTAHFWEVTGSGGYWPIVRSVALGATGRDVSDNALLFAAVAMALDDAIIATWDAKYTYNFWRPLTAIRNGDIDGNAATDREAAWMPLIDTPPHPEYPCAHCVAAGAIAAVLEAVIGGGPVPWLASPSPTLPGVIHRWARTADLVTEVEMARILDGVHFRNSAEVGAVLGRKVGDLVVASFLKPAMLTRSTR